MTVRERYELSKANEKVITLPDDFKLSIKDHFEMLKELENDLNDCIQHVGYTPEQMGYDK